MKTDKGEPIVLRFLRTNIVRIDLFFLKKNVDTLI